MFIYRSICLSLLSICFSPVALSAAETNSNPLSQAINAMQSTPEKKQAAITAGRDRALLCSVCHGKDGNSTKPEVPNLASQNTVYLLDQIAKFADGRRKDYVMNSLAKDFTDDDKINLAIFYNNMPVKPVSVDQQLAVQGKKLYEAKCISCHGPHGTGQASFARIAGQQPAYVVKTLKNFRSNANKKETENTSKRSNYIMEAIVQSYSDQDIEKLAAYVAVLK